MEEKAKACTVGSIKLTKVAAMIKFADCNHIGNYHSHGLICMMVTQGF